MKPPLPLILPVENQVREFDAKLLLACCAAERRMPVFLGCHARIGERMHDFPRSVYVGKAVTEGSMKLFRIVRQLGHGLTAWDEEALIYMSPDFYLRRRTSPETLGSLDALFAWGEDNAEIWRGAPGYRGQPLHADGNPRGDLLRPDLRGLHQAEADLLRERHGDFVLINSNFGSVNLYFAELSRPRLEKMGRAEEEPVPEDKRGTWDDPGMIRFRYALFQAFQRMLPELARRMPDRRFIFRPHPSENPEIWERIAADLPNVEVVGGGGIVPWLLAASVVVQNGCTTGLESFLLGRPVVAYKPVSDPVYDMELPNALSEIATDVDSLAAAIVKVVENGPTVDDARRRLADRFIASRDGPLASERILDSYRAMQDDGVFEAHTPFRERLSGQWASRHRQIKKAIRGRRKDNFDSAEYIRYRFPDLTVRDVEARIGRLHATTGRFGKVRARRCWNNVFSLSVER